MYGVWCGASERLPPGRSRRRGQTGRLEPLGGDPGRRQTLARRSLDRCLCWRPSVRAPLVETLTIRCSKRWTRCAPSRRPAMAEVVVDASALVDLLLDDELGSAVKRRLSGHALHAPAHVDAEIISALGRLMRAGTVEADDVTTMLRAPRRRPHPAPSGRRTAPRRLGTAPPVASGGRPCTSSSRRRAACRSSPPTVACARRRASTSSPRDAGHELAKPGVAVLGARVRRGRRPAAGRPAERTERAFSRLSAGRWRVSRSGL